MIPLVAEKKNEIAEHCRRLGVERLEVFGSAARGTFDPEKSDIDFLVEFSNHNSPGILKRYLDLVESLETLFNRRVDLVTTYQGRAIQKFSTGQTLESYLGNDLLRSGIERKFEIVGEALNRASCREPSLHELGNITGMRHHIIHGYDFIDDTIVWDTVQSHLPALICELEEEIRSV